VKVGVLALQGAVDAHRRLLESLDIAVLEVRRPHDLDLSGGIDAIVLPGGESTTMSRLLVTSGLFEPLAARLHDGLPALGTCAGMITLAREVIDGRPDQRSFGVIDIAVRRNAFGRQVDSFESDIEIEGIRGEAFHGVFIRAPFVETIGPRVELMAEVDGHPVACRQGCVWVTSFHPELARTRDGRLDARVHEAFLTATI
jgi:5'-phosphate synthase pdxT subunit